MPNTGDLDYILNVGINFEDVGNNLEKMADTFDSIGSGNDGSASQIANLTGMSEEQVQNGFASLRLSASALRDPTNLKNGKLTFGEEDLANYRKAETFINQLAAAYSGLSDEQKKAYAALGDAVASIGDNARKANKQLSSLEKVMKGMQRSAANFLYMRAMQWITSNIQQAFTYIEKLDKSLNNIQIVTQKSSTEMAEFAQNANEAAQKLGTTTTEYTNASLIYYQQGLSDSQAQERAETTIKASNVTGQSAQQVSENLTAVWNGYNVSSSEIESYVDKLAAVAANSASNLNELSTAISKVASTAAMTGVSMDSLTAQISTIISVTRQAPESVGTALKTIYARMEDFKVGDAVDGVELGTVSGQLDALGIHLLDTTGQMRDLGDVIEEIGGKWGVWTKAQQMAIAEAIAGKRQYNNLIALFDNFDKYTENKKVAEGSEGTLERQQQTYLSSIDAAKNRMQASFEDLYASLIDNESIRGFYDLLSNIAQIIDVISDNLGGLKGVIQSFGPLMTSFLIGDQIGTGITTASNWIVSGVKNLLPQKNAPMSRTNSPQVDGNKTENPGQGNANNSGMPNSTQNQTDNNKDEEKLKAQATKVTKVSQAFLAEAAAILTVVNASKTLGQTMADDTLTTGEKVSKVIATVGSTALSVVPSILMMSNALKGLKLEGALSALIPGVGIAAAVVGAGLAIASAQKAAVEQKAKNTASKNQKAIDAAKENLKEIDSIKDLEKEYQNAQAYYKSTGDGKEKLKSATEKLLEAYGAEKTEIDALGNSYSQYAEKVKAAELASNNEIIEKNEAASAGYANSLRTGENLTGFEVSKDGSGRWENIQGNGKKYIFNEATTKLVKGEDETLHLQFYHQETNGIGRPILKEGLPSGIDLATAITEGKFAFTNYTGNTGGLATLQAMLTQLKEESPKSEDEKAKNNEAQSILNSIIQSFTNTSNQSIQGDIQTALAYAKNDAINGNSDNKEEIFDIINRVGTSEMAKQLGMENLAASAEDIYDVIMAEASSAYNIIDKEANNHAIALTILPKIDNEEINKGTLVDFIEEKLNSGYSKEALSMALTISPKLDTDKLEDVLKNVQTILSGNTVQVQVAAAYDSELNMTTGNYDKATNPLATYLTNHPELEKNWDKNGFLTTLGYDNYAEAKKASSTVYGISSAQRQAIWGQLQKEAPKNTGVIKDSLSSSFESFLEKTGISTEMEKRAGKQNFNIQDLTNADSVDDIENYIRAKYDEETAKDYLQQLGTLVSSALSLSSYGITGYNILNLGGTTGGLMTLANSKNLFKTDNPNGDETAKALAQVVGSSGILDKNFEIWQKEVLEDEKGNFLSNEVLAKRGAGIAKSLALESLLKDSDDFNDMTEQQKRAFSDTAAEGLKMDSSTMYTALAQKATGTFNGLKEFFSLMHKNGADLSTLIAGINFEDFKGSTEDIQSLIDNIKNSDKTIKDKDIESIWQGYIKSVLDALGYTENAINEIINGISDYKGFADSVAKEYQLNAAQGLSKDISSLRQKMATGTVAEKNEAEQTFAESLQATGADIVTPDEILNKQLIYNQSENDLAKANEDKEWALQNNIPLEESYNQAIKIATQKRDEAMQSYSQAVSHQGEIEKYAKGLYDFQQTGQWTPEMDAIKNSYKKDEQGNPQASSMLGFATDYSQLSTIQSQVGASAEEYNAALGRLNETVQENLGYTDEQMMNYAKMYGVHLPATKKAWDELSDAEKASATKMIQANQTINKMVSSLDNYKKAVKKINADGTIKTEDAQKAIAELQGYFKDLTGLNFGTDFIKKNWKDIENFIKGDKTLGEVMDDYFKDITPKNLSNYINDIKDAMSQGLLSTENFKRLDINWYDYLGVGEFQSVCQQIADGTLSTEGSIKEALGNIHLAPQVDMQKVIGEIKAAGADGSFSEADITGLVPLVTYTADPNARGLVGNKGSKSSGGGSQSKKHDKKKASDEVDPYHEETKRLASLTNALEALNKENDKLTGQAKIDNLNKQLDILEEQEQVQQSILETAKEQAALAEQELAAGTDFNTSGYFSGISLEKDEYGNITNYEEIRQQALEAYNRAADVSMDDDAWKKVENDYEELISALDQYENAVDKMEEAKSAIQEEWDTAVENSISAFKVTIEASVDWTEAKNSYNDYINAITDYTSEAAQKASESYNKAMVSQQTGVLDQYVKGLQETSAALTAIRNGDYTSTMYGDDAATALEDLKTYTSDLEQEIQTVKENLDSLKESYAEAFEEMQEDIEDLIDDYEYFNDIIEHNINIITALNGDEAYGELAAQYQSQLENQKNEISVYASALQEWSSAFEQAKEDYEAGLLTEEGYNQIRDQLKESTQDLNEAIEDELEIIADLYESKIKEIFDNFTKQYTNGIDLDTLSDQWKLVTDHTDKYYDDIQKAYKLEEIQSKFQKAIDDNDNLKAQQKLTEAMNEQLAILEAKDELSKADVERAEKVLELTQAEIALQEAQENKTQMRLRRDSQGNYSYVYTADESAVDEAQEKVTELKDQLYTFDKEQFQSGLEEIYNVYKEYVEKMQDILTDATLSDEDRQGKIDTLKSWYDETLNDAVRDYNDIYDLFLNDVMEQGDMGADEAKAYIEEMFGVYQSLAESISSGDITANMTDVISSAEDLAAEGRAAALDASQESADLLSGVSEQVLNSMDNISNVLSTNEENISTIRNQVSELQDYWDSLGSYITEIEDAQAAMDEEYGEEVASNTDGMLEQLKAIYERLSQFLNTYNEDNGKYAAYETSTSSSGDSSSSSGGSGSSGSKGKGSKKSSSSSSSSETSSAITYSASDNGEGEYVIKDSNGVSYTLSDAGDNGTTYVVKTKTGVKTGTISGYSPGQYYDKLKKQIAANAGGGLTPSWSSDGSAETGKLAILHPDEMILNSFDTETFLEAMNALSSSQTMADYLVEAIDRITSTETNAKPAQTTTEQQVQIDATFPNVSDSKEVEDALKNLTNTALQYVNVK